LAARGEHFISSPGQGRGLFKGAIDVVVSWNTESVAVQGTVSSLEIAMSSLAEETAVFSAVKRINLDNGVSIVVVNDL